MRGAGGLRRPASPRPAGDRASGSAAVGGKAREAFPAQLAGSLGGRARGAVMVVERPRRPSSCGPEGPARSKGGEASGGVLFARRANLG